MGRILEFGVVVELWRRFALRWWDNWGSRAFRLRSVVHDAFEEPTTEPSILVVHHFEEELFAIGLTLRLKINAPALFRRTYLVLLCS